MIRLVDVDVPGIPLTQQLLDQRGYDVGRIDGILGEQTRPAIRDVQMKFKLPEDSYPTEELLQRLRGGDGGGPDGSSMSQYEWHKESRP